ncbi:hypothetical protein JIN86_10470 [Lysinibacillus sp. HST-98]|uniref:hypothetical protein n=1 Tax=Lysinibacillus sp. HST-98 TaxID=2800419 RepID=UPI0019262578|nr:hypothetical protein [Lysinibacillus sp. HST-98]MBL3730028.1 hypothetical protein [Lysinibacillus sp. HST-98]
MEEDNNVITPFGTFWGSDGTATFNYMPTARSFSWTLNIPAASGAFLSYVSPQAYDNGIPFMY